MTYTPLTAKLKFAVGLALLRISPGPVKVPSLWKSKLYLRPAAVSTGDGSKGLAKTKVAGTPRVTLPWTPNWAVGATFVAVTAVWAVPVPPPSSVTTRLTVYTPLSGGAKVKLGPFPPGTATPLFDV